MGKREKQPVKQQPANKQRTKKKSGKKGDSLNRGLKVLMVLLLLLAILLAAAYGYLRSKLDLLQRGDDQSTQITEPAEDGLDPDAMLSDVLSDAEAQAAAEELARQAASAEAAMEGLEEAEVVEATGEMIKDDKVYNIMLFGTDERTTAFSTRARGDSCMLLSINTNGEKPVISLVSFERAIGVPILEGQYQGQYDWLTHTFNYGGAELQMAEVRECFNINVDYYVRVNFATFIQGIDAIGGVDIELTSAEARAIGAYAGNCHLNGTLALEYARLRKIDSDWKRVERQRTVIQAALEQVKDLSVSELDNLLNTVLPLVQTNLPDDKILELLTLAPSLLGGVEMQQMTIPQSGTYGVMSGMGGRSLYAVDFDANAKILNEFLYGTNE